MTHEAQAVEYFMQIGGQTTDHINVEQVGLYTGLQLEELAEKLRVLGINFIADTLDELSADFKAGHWGRRIATMTPSELTEFLDADIDLAWVSLGAAYSLGVNVEQAFEEVSDSNVSKAVDCPACAGRGDDECICCDGHGLVMAKDANGKIVKGPNFFKPQLQKFIFQALDRSYTNV